MAEALVPVGNLYRMLCYAWHRADRRELSRVDVDAFDNVEDLLAHLLIHVTRDILRRGLARGYRQETDELRSPRGRIEVSQTVKRLLERHSRVACSFDELTDDISINQILRSTMRALSHSAKTRLGHELRQLDVHFGNVGVVPLNASTFSRVRLHAGHSYYALALDICTLAARSLVPSSDGKPWRFIDPRRSDEEMGLLFEDFVRAFLRTSQSRYTVQSERRLHWNLKASSDGAEHVLPSMETDIRIATTDELALIEVKFTNSPLRVGKDGRQRLRERYLYQLYAYATHLAARSELPLRRVILLIGSPGSAFTFEYVGPDGARWTARCIDLAQSWDHLAADVLQLVAA